MSPSGKLLVTNHLGTFFSDSLLTLLFNAFITNKDRVSVIEPYCRLCSPLSIAFYRIKLSVLDIALAQFWQNIYFPTFGFILWIFLEKKNVARE